MTSLTRAIDPRLDLVLERELDVPPTLVWRAWTEPDLLKQWFTPHPWKTTECEIDLRPGGIFRTVMRGPNGEENAGTGCILEVETDRRLTWTGALLPGFRPIPRSDEMLFTAVISLEPQGTGTRYSAVVLHSDEQGRDSHEEMGFHAGWGAALDQLIELVKRL